MKRTLELSLLVAGLLWGTGAFAAASGAPIEDPLRVDFPPTANFTEAEVGDKIKDMAIKRNWRVDSDKPGRLLLGTNFNNKHLVRVEIEYAATGYTLRYVESHNLRYRPQSRTIHPNYNVWMRDLCVAINSSLGVSAIAGVPLTVPAAAAATAPFIAAAAAPGPAAEGMPAVGSKWRYGYRDRQYDRREQFFTVEVAGVDQTRVRERLMVDGGDFTETVLDTDKFAFTTRRISASQSVLELTPYLRDAQNKPSHPPEGYPKSASATWKITTPEYVEEEVRVPAGTFKALRIEIRGSSEEFGTTLSTTTARFAYVAWYSRELSRYVKIHHQTWDRRNAQIGDEQVQLIVYQPGK